MCLGRDGHVVKTARCKSKPSQHARCRTTCWLTMLPRREPRSRQMQTREGHTWGFVLLVHFAVQRQQLSIAPVTQLQQGVLINCFTGFLVIQCNLQASHVHLAHQLTPIGICSACYEQHVLWQLLTEQVLVSAHLIQVSLYQEQWSSPKYCTEHTAAGMA